MSPSRARASRFALLSIVFVAWTSSAQQSPPPAAQSPQRDPQALSVLEQSLVSSGGTVALGSIQDFTASGSITYFWADQGVQGAVIVRGIPQRSYRLDANLPGGTRSWIVAQGNGSLRESNGSITSIAYSTAASLFGLTLPQFTVLEAIQDSSTVVMYEGLETELGISVHHVRLQPAIGLEVSPNSGQKDIYIDASTLQVVLVREVMFPVGGQGTGYKHEVRFSDYRQIGIAVLPFAITETLGGQQSSTIQFASINFNTGLTDTDFTF